WQGFAASKIKIDEVTLGEVAPPGKIKIPRLASTRQRMLAEDFRNRTRQRVSEAHRRFAGAVDLARLGGSNRAARVDDFLRIKKAFALDTKLRNCPRSPDARRIGHVWIAFPFARRIPAAEDEIRLLVGRGWEQRD